MATPCEHIFLSDIARSWYGKGWTGAVVECETKLLLKLVRHKGFTLTPEQQARIESCTDPDLLETWVDRMLAANSPADVFGPA